MKILKSEKLSSANKWALAVVPHEDFQVLNCVTEKKVTNTACLKKKGDSGNH